MTGTDLQRGARACLRGRYALHLFALFSCVLLLIVSGCAAEPDTEFDRGRLERAEDLSESLANDLLALSVAVRDRDGETARGFFAERVVATAFSGEAPQAVPLTRWIETRTWELPEEAAVEGRDVFLERFHSLFDRFGEIEDARFKVKAASFDEAAGDRGSASIKFYAVGRNERRRREWLKGTADIEVERASGGIWRIRELRVTALGSKVSSADLFSEVSAPAGVSALFPAFGTAGNEGFVAHGAAAADVNLDGLIDLAATGVDRNFLYVNTGDGTFRDASNDSLVGFAPTGSGALFLDYDNDGDPDLFLAAVGEQILLENRFVP
ncbi:MAG: VCBS repeat-containing protein, partial [Acidobacteriota bacterium]|nr:VCBS repeat-containing protein [Acidobacteriota bacterium]